MQNYFHKKMLFVLLLSVLCLHVHGSKPRNLLCKAIRVIIAKLIAPKHSFCKEFDCNNFGHGGKAFPDSNFGTPTLGSPQRVTPISSDLRSLFSGTPRFCSDLLRFLLKTNQGNPFRPTPFASPRQICGPDNFQSASFRVFKIATFSGRSRLGTESTDPGWTPVPLLLALEAAYRGTNLLHEAAGRGASLMQAGTGFLAMLR